MNLHSLFSSLKIWRGYYTGFLRRKKGEKWVRKPQGLWILEFYGKNLNPVMVKKLSHF